MEDCPPYRVGTYGILISSFNLVALNFFLENENRRILNSLILPVTAQHINSLPIPIRLVSSKRGITENMFCIKETISLPGLSTFNNVLTCIRLSMHRAQAEPLSKISKFQNKISDILYIIYTSPVDNIAVSNAVDVNWILASPLPVILITDK